METNPVNDNSQDASPRSVSCFLWSDRGTAPPRRLNRQVDVLEELEQDSHLALD